MEIDLSTKEGRDEARQNLYSEFGVSSIVDQEKPTFKEGAKERFEKNKPFLEIIDELDYRLEEKDKDNNFKVGDKEEDVTKMLNETKLDDGKTLYSALKEKGIEVEENDYYAGEGFNYLDIIKNGEKIGKEINLSEKGEWRNKLLNALKDVLLTDTEEEAEGLSKGVQVNKNSLNADKR
jgi:hypothetical protein